VDSSTIFLCTLIINDLYKNWLKKLVRYCHLCTKWWNLRIVPLNHCSGNVLDQDTLKLCIISGNKLMSSVWRKHILFPQSRRTWPKSSGSCHESLRYKSERNGEWHIFVLYQCNLLSHSLVTISTNFDLLSILSCGLSLSKNNQEIFLLQYFYSI
jgi:hypothetical protein